MSSMGGKLTKSHSPRSGAVRASLRQRLDFVVRLHWSSSRPEANSMRLSISKMLDDEASVLVPKRAEFTR